MAFVKARKQTRTMEDIKVRVYERASELAKGERLANVTPGEKPWRATDLTVECPRLVYYKRYERNTGTDRVSIAAVFGTTIHSMLQHGAPDDEEMFFHLIEDNLIIGGANSIYDERIDWYSGAKPFSLAGFRDANPEQRIGALFLRYMELDRVNFQAFWDIYPVAIYRHPETGRLAQEVRLNVQVSGYDVRAVADAVLTDVYAGDLMATDWKTGRAGDPTQLATYAMAAEEFYRLEPGTIAKGCYVMTGQGTCYAKRGKLPHGYEADPTASVQVMDLAPWRHEVRSRLERLARREETGVWTPKLNPLCYNTCQFRFKCPVGKAVQEIKGERKNG